MDRRYKVHRSPWERDIFGCVGGMYCFMFRRCECTMKTPARVIHQFDIQAKKHVWKTYSFTGSCSLYLNPQFTCLCGCLTETEKPGGGNGCKLKCANHYGYPEPLPVLFGLGHNFFSSPTRKVLSRAAIGWLSGLWGFHLRALRLLSKQTITQRVFVQLSILIILMLLIILEDGVVTGIEYYHKRLVSFEDAVIW